MDVDERTKPLRKGSGKALNIKVMERAGGKCSAKCSDGKRRLR